MKKKLKYLLVAFILLFSFVNVTAERVDPSDIPDLSYVIGRHEFTSEMLLTTKHIMLAAKTIDSDKLEDMMIYYKMPGGTWIDGLTGEEIEFENALQINYVDLVNTLTLTTPGEITINERTLDGTPNTDVISSYQSYNPTKGALVYSMSINTTPYISNNHFTVDGYEICVVENNKCIDVLADVSFISDSIDPVDTRATVNLEVGKVYSLAARVYLRDDGGDIVHSELGDTLIVENIISQPVLSKELVGYSNENGTYEYKLSIDGEHFANFDYYAIYKLTGNTETQVRTGIGVNETYSVFVNEDAVNDTIYVARVFAHDSNNEPKRGNASDPLTVKFEALPKATISNPNAENVDKYATYESESYQVATFTGYSDGIYTYDLALDLSPYTVESGYSADGFVICRSPYTDASGADEDTLTEACFDESYFIAQLNLNALPAGYSIVEGADGNYIKIPVQVESGKVEHFRAVPYIKIGNPEKYIYSPISNAFTVDASVPVPTLLADTKFHELDSDGYYNYEFAVDSNALTYCLPGSVTSEIVNNSTVYTCSSIVRVIDGFKLYNGSKSQLGIADYSGDVSTITVQIHPGEVGEYYAKAFTKVVTTSTATVESQFTDKFTVNDFETFVAPTLSREAVPQLGNGDGNYTYLLSINYKNYADSTTNPQLYKIGYYKVGLFNEDGTVNTEAGYMVSTTPNEQLDFTLPVNTTKNVFAVACAKYLDDAQEPVEVCSEKSTAFEIDAHIVKPELSVTLDTEHENTYILSFNNITSYVNSDQTSKSIDGFVMQYWNETLQTWKSITGSDDMLPLVANGNPNVEHTFTAPSGTNISKLKFRMMVYVEINEPQDTLHETSEEVIAPTPEVEEPSGD